MPRKIIVPETGGFYHIVNRGVEQRDIFLDDQDRTRFANSLLVFNDRKPAPWSMRGFWDHNDPSDMVDYTPEYPFVEIHAFAFMNNHIHLLLRQVQDFGISEFMRKIGGYVTYFNKKYGRVGSLFQGRFRAVQIRSDTQLQNTFIYIHTNPVEFVEPGWKEWSVQSPSEAMRFLEGYYWSSFRDYLGEEAFSKMVHKEVFQELFGGPEKCREAVKARVRDKTKRNSTLFEEVLLE